MRMSQHLPGSAAHIVKALRAAGLEGVIAKRISLESVRATG